MVKKDIPLRYRNDFTGNAVISFPVFGDVKEVETPFECTVENSALGGVRVSVSIREKIDYPVVPVIRAIKDHILSLEETGQLP
jgi:hypothetical protein